MQHESLLLNKREPQFGGFALKFGILTILPLTRRGFCICVHRVWKSALITLKKLQKRVLNIICITYFGRRMWCVQLCNFIFPRNFKRCGLLIYNIYINIFLIFFSYLSLLNKINSDLDCQGI